MGICMCESGDRAKKIWMAEHLSMACARENVAHRTTHPVWTSEQVPGRVHAASVAVDATRDTIVRWCRCEGGDIVCGCLGVFVSVWRPEGAVPASMAQSCLNVWNWLSSSSALDSSMVLAYDTPVMRNSTSLHVRVLVWSQAHLSALRATQRDSMSYTAWRVHQHVAHVEVRVDELCLLAPPWQR
ncbi:hypothetical protein K439DRAFT_1620488 [Ramaria rubella]|nr:hypothetical protein K439DRAFT_1620488 [Ramaria rubella]